MSTSPETPSPDHLPDATNDGCFSIPLQPFIRVFRHLFAKHPQENGAADNPQTTPASSAVGFSPEERVAVFEGIIKRIKNVEEKVSDDIPAAKLEGILLEELAAPVAALLLRIHALLLRKNEEDPTLGFTAKNALRTIRRYMRNLQNQHGMEVIATYITDETVRSFRNAPR